MALMAKQLFSYLHRGFDKSVQVQQVRHQFVDRRMLKDYNRRLLVKQHGKERLRLNSLRKNRILPPELQALADEEIQALPINSSITRPVARCVVTSRSRGLVRPYRVSRIIFRHLADYNLLAGWQRARW